MTTRQRAEAYADKCEKELEAFDPEAYFDRELCMEDYTAGSRETLTAFCAALMERCRGMAVWDDNGIGVLDFEDLEKAIEDCRTSESSDE